VPGSTKSFLPTILQRCFDPNAGRPGTRHRVVFRGEGDRWMLKPLETLVSLVYAPRAPVTPRR